MNLKRRSTDSIQLRAEAQTRFSHSTSSALTSTDEAALRHELLVYQIELEMQNDELQKAHTKMEEARDRYVDLYEFAPVGYLTISRQGLISEINLTGSTLLGIERKKLVKRRFAQFIAPEDRERWHRMFLGIMAEEEAEIQSFEFVMVRFNGSSFYALIDCQRKDAIGEQPTLRVTLADIHKLKESEAELRIAAVAFEAQEGMMVTDAHNTILRVNEAFIKITGYAPEEVIGKNPQILGSGLQDSAFYTAMWEQLGQQGIWSGEIWNKRKNGEIYPESLSITTVKNRHGDITNYVASFADITLSKSAANEIQHLAFNDPLTNLPNRRFLMDRLEHELASSTRTGHKGALLFLDLDNFKVLNDTMGHNIGDLLLKLVAERLITCVRDCDTVARLGGDEFVILLEGLGEHLLEAASQADAVASKILMTLSQPYLLEGHEHNSSASIGVTLIDENKLHIEELLKQADIAMYQAKQSGRSSIRFFDQQMQENISARVKLEEELRRALINKDLVLHYQFQTHLGQVTGAEALVRWQHPQQGIVYPVEFIALAEETGLILPLGAWVLEAACAQLKAWKLSNLTRDLLLSINVSARQFFQPDFVAQVACTLQRYDVNPNLIKFELTEGVLIKSIEETIATMTTLKAMGIKFSLDDFGTGYSSLQYLKRLPLDQLKIDKSFVHDITIDHRDRAVVRTIIGMAESLGLEVIAEGVETEGQKLCLLNIGCSNFQGYLFGKPMQISEFETMLKS
ncbi:MAG: EAL domain-containing protein [Pseudomonadales bacterium]|nr:EAL domain-containing protein [Pseudomonadales bacterium]